MTTFDDRWRQWSRARWRLHEYNEFLVALGFNAQAAAFLIQKAYESVIPDISWDEFNTRYLEPAFRRTN